MDVSRIADIWGERTPFPVGGSWPVRVDQHLTAGVEPADVDRWVSGACLLCSNGCGLEVAVKDGRMVGVGEGLAVLCSESLWWRCHRRLLADYLVLVRDVPVLHLMHDGRLTPHPPTDGVRRDGDHLVYDVDDV